LASRTACEGGVFVVVERARWWAARACVDVVVVVVVSMLGCVCGKACFGVVGF